MHVSQVFFLQFFLQVFLNIFLFLIYLKFILSLSYYAERFLAFKIYRCCHNCVKLTFSYQLNLTTVTKALVSIDKTIPCQV